MKKTIKFSYASAVVVAIAALLISGCKDFLDVNTDPTRLKTASVSQALSAAQASMAFYQGSDVFLYSSIFSQQATGSGVTNTQTRLYDQYVLTTTDVNNAFTNYYAGSLADFDYVRKQSLKEGNPQYAGIAKIMQGYTFSTLVDAWGNIPYKEALKGVSNVQPKYDNSKEIYDSLFVLIDAGIANTKQPNIRTVTAEDLIYSGTMSQWEKFGNTLKLRLALHYAKEDAGVKLKAVIAAGGPFMTGSGDNFQMAFEDINNRQNPIHQFEVSRGNYYAPSTLLVNMMNTKTDPRRPMFFTPSPFPPATLATTGASSAAGTATLNFAQQGFAPYPVGATITVSGVIPAGFNGTYTVTASTTTSVSYANATAGPQTGPGTITYNPVPTYVGFTSNSGQVSPNSRIHTYLRGAVKADDGSRTAQGSPTNIAITYSGTAPSRMLTFAEYNFIRAEAIIMYGAPGPSNVGVGTLVEAQAYYQAGITASMTDAGVIPGDIATYIAANGTLVGTPATDLQMIIEEKFVANYGVCMEPWTDWRRTGFPVLTTSVAAAAVGNTAIPRILVYPLSEEQTNIGNLPPRSSMALKSVFWDK